jgi:hypothetical protein
MGAVGIILISTPESRRHRLLNEHLAARGLRASVAPSVFLDAPRRTRRHMITPAGSSAMG